MKQKIIAFTGHRPNKLPEFFDSYTNKKSLLIFLYHYLKKDLSEFELTLVSGGALGFDQIAIHLLPQFVVSSWCRHVPKLIIAEPFVGFDSKWTNQQQLAYMDMRLCANEIIIVNQELDTKTAPYWAIAQAMQNRNEHMVDMADEIVAYWDGSKGGTANCIKYANKVGKPVFNIYEDYQKFLETFEC